MQIMEEYDPEKPNDYDEIQQQKKHPLKISPDEIPKNFAQVSSVDSKIGEKLLKKMGWSEGRGLGKNEQGMVTPIIVRKVEGRSKTIGVIESASSSGMNSL